jgi:hypothetical protein
MQGKDAMPAGAIAKPAGARSCVERSNPNEVGGSRVARRTPLYAVEVAGTGIGVPAQSLSSAEIDARLGKPEGWTQRVSGVTTRRVVDRETTIDLSVESATPDC